MAKQPAKKARPVGDIIKEGMDVTATAPPVDPDDASDLISSGERESWREDAGDEATEGDDILEKLTNAINSLAARQAEAAAGGGGDSRVLEMMGMMAQSQALLASAIEKMGANQMKGSQLIASATRKANRPSNEIPPNISVFNLRGDKDFPKPKLKCDMFLPWPAEPESLDREETELLNLLEPGDYMVVRNDKTKIKVEVRCEYKLDSDTPSKLLIHHDTAFNNDYHRMMPPMTDMLRGMLKQNPKSKAKSLLVLTMDEEMALIAANQYNDGTPVPEGKSGISLGE